MLQRAETPAQLAGVEASRAFFAECMTGAPRETLWVAHVDGQARCIHLDSYGSGDGEAGFPLGEILGDAARLGSAGLMVAQRAESPIARPNVSKRAATLDLALAADAIGVTLLDCLMFVGPECRSMRRLGLL